MTLMELYVMHWENGTENWVENYYDMWRPHPKDGQMTKASVHLLYFLQMGIWIDTCAFHADHTRLPSADANHRQPPSHLLPVANHRPMQRKPFRACTPQVHTPPFRRGTPQRLLPHVHPPLGPCHHLPPTEYTAAASLSPKPPPRCSPTPEHVLAHFLPQSLPPDPIAATLA